MPKELPTQIQTILNETYDELKSLYAGHLKDIILFGSYARGDYMKNTLKLLPDLDLLSWQLLKSFMVFRLNTLI